MHVFRTVRFGSVCGACTPLKRQAPRAAVSAARNTAALTAVGNSSLVAAGMTNF